MISVFLSSARRDQCMGVNPTGAFTMLHGPTEQLGSPLSLFGVFTFPIIVEPGIAFGTACHFDLSYLYVYLWVLSSCLHQLRSWNRRIHGLHGSGSYPVEAIGDSVMYSIPLTTKVRREALRYFPFWGDAFIFPCSISFSLD